MEWLCDVVVIADHNYQTTEFFREEKLGQIFQDKNRLERGRNTEIENGGYFCNLFALKSKKLASSLSRVEHNKTSFSHFSIISMAISTFRWK